jgi:hypothetical protein
LLRSLNKSQELPLVDTGKRILNHDHNAWVSTGELMIFFRILLPFIFVLACGKYTDSGKN